MIESEEAAKAYVGGFADDAAMARLELLERLLIEESDRQNLISRGSIPEIWRRHIADSAQLLAHVPRETQQILAEGGIWLDLGTGAGFPGLLIAALRPAWHIRLVESRRKRIEWLEYAGRELELSNCLTIGSRVEAVETVSASVISGRAFAPMPRLLDLSARFSTERTLWLLPKGRSAGQDLAQLPESARKLFHVEQSCTDPVAGIIVGRLAGQISRKQARNHA